ncbi:unnamed protein product [Ceutorhynchus assimilis]|uniref:Uncharacterized protein n=1 Tax=Ceutorhynchus assimilis TaxID=467358 RepID=A0A9P0GJY8_9CUCU|nr:unnamed protein product [Ceutorhynchus assimilis]
MFLTVFISVLVTLYILFCIGLYTFYYFVEVVLDLPATGQSPCTAHAALKQLIEKLLKEAVNLPLLEKAHAHPAIPSEETTNKTYEDLLATAIINKVITSCQNNLPSSSANSVSSSSRNKDGKEYFFGEETLDTKWKNTDLDTTSVSSLEEWLQSSDNSFGSRKYVDKVTLMIKQDIEEVENVDSENEEDDDAEYFRSSSSLLDDNESNWFLQKRHFQGTASPVPVPMLVPNPSSEAKVLIGDKPLDDTSDLSDVGSDIEESVQPQTAQTLLIQSKNLIGGATGANQNYENADVQSESSTDSGVKEMNGNAQKSFDLLGDSIGKTDISIDDDNVEDSSFISVYSNTEKEAEYTERYASLPRQILKPSTPQNSKVALENEDDILEDTSDFEFIGGTYSKKEKEKWTHAVEMKNNPYSKENIEKRMKKSNSSIGSIFGPDYYARLAGKPSGGGKASSEINGVSWPPPHQTDYTRSETPSPLPELPKSAPPSKELILEHPKTTQFSPSRDLILDIPPEPPKTAPPPFIIETDGIHQAVKALVTPEEDHIMPHKALEQVHKVESYSVQLSTAEVTSESDTSFVNFYDVEHGQVMKKTKNEDVHQIPIKPQPPVARPRVLGGESKKYEKASSKNMQRNNSPIERPILRRHLSESSLLDDSVDAHPKALHQKKDNTLISKIYKDPKIRLFALNSREGVIHGDKQYLSQKSLDSKISLGTSASDDGLTSEYESGKTGKMSFFSSEEDLLSLNSEVSFVATKNGDVKLNESEHRNIRTPSPSPLITPNTPSTRKFIYSSQEDLLSIDEVGSLPQRKDNTLISKIYQDHKVRNFALNTNREFQPDLHSKPRKVSSSDEEHYHYNEKVTIQKRNFAHKYNSYDDLSSADMSFEDNYQNGHNLSIDQKSATLMVKTSSAVSSVNDGYNSEDLEIEEIARRHVVREALGKFSKSEMVINSNFHRGTSFEEGDVRVSVRDLRKKFETNEVSNKPVVSSLTARSISKKVKDSLKQ